MKSLTRLIILIAFFITASFLTAKPVKALDLVQWFMEVTGIEQNTSNTLEAQVAADETGAVSLNSFVPETSNAWEADAYLKLNGVPENSPTVQKMTDEQKKIVYAKYGRGAIGETTQALAMLYNPPASGVTYVATLLEDAHIIPQAHAQGLGFSSLDPVLEAWKVFRNIAYFFFVVIFLVIGFMIMFRQNLGGQTVVTAQQAIPGIIVSLIFVTFSYAIAGFLIDLMYLIMYLMIGLFRPDSGVDLLSKNFLQIGWDLVTGVNGSGAFANMNEAVKSFAGAIDTGAVGDVLGWLGGLTLGLIVSVAILIGVFKLFFDLLKIYITIIIAIVVAPVLLMMGALPGKSNFGYWIKIVFGNLMAFPMVLFSLILYELFTKGDINSGGFLPPYLIGRGSGGVIMTLVGIGIILVIPELIVEMKKAMKIDGGIWETLAFKAVKNMAAGEPALPLATGAIGAVGGAAKAGIMSYGRQNPRAFLTDSLWRGAKTGEKDENGRDIRAGGVLQGWSGGVETGKKGRVFFDQARSGNLFDPQDSTKILDKLLNKKEGGTTKPHPRATDKAVD
ncbi:MAG: hypothetical protein COU63_03565 [Candidatus Pacebacteria bacterium CG10_big_fil_rev_8_21_14_0_10_36_11]|nr:MAG: hypothetical protein COU63_03565 [Candidatus Pacebacteria bacterium CG10_big_fil_rev_8_21_14_0_10_36_11]